MSDEQKDPNPESEPGRIVYGPAFGEQTQPDQMTDGDEGDIPAPLTVAGPLGEAVVLTPSPQAGPTTRYHKGKLIWAARYADNSLISQYDDDGNPVSVDTLSRDGLRAFLFLDEEGRPAYIQELLPGQQLIYRRRTALRTGEDVIEVIHIVGWSKQVGEEEIRHVAFIFESDLHIEMGDFRKDMREGYGRPDQWRYPIKFTDADRQEIS